MWPIIAYNIIYSEIRTNLSYGHPLIPRRPDKRGLTIFHCNYTMYVYLCIYLLGMIASDSGIVSPSDQA